jgi:hypothetical protein
MGFIGFFIEKPKTQSAEFENVGFSHPCTEDHKELFCPHENGLKSKNEHILCKTSKNYPVWYCSRSNFRNGSKPFLSGSGTVVATKPFLMCG